MSLYQVLNYVTFPIFQLCPFYTFTAFSLPLSYLITLDVEDNGAPDHTQKHTIGRNPLDEGSACRRDLYLPTHNTHNRQISMPSEGFEPAILASQRKQIPASDRTATGIGSSLYVTVK